MHVLCAAERKCGCSLSLLLTLSQSVFSLGAAWTILKPFSSALAHQHTTWWIQNEGAVLSVMIVEDYQQAERREVSQITSFLSSEAYSKLPHVSQIVSIGKLSLQSCLSPLQKFLLFPPASQYAPKVALKNPSSVTISFMHVMVFNRRSQLLLEISKTPLCQSMWDTSFHCLVLFFLCLRFSFAKVSQLSTKWTYFSRHIFINFLTVWGAFTL